MRVSPADADLLYRPPRERALARAAFAASRLGRPLRRTGLVMFFGGMVIGYLGAVFQPDVGVMAGAFVTFLGFVCGCLGVAVGVVSGMTGGPASLLASRRRRTLLGAAVGPEAAAQEGETVNVHGIVGALETFAGPTGPTVMRRVRFTRDGRGADVELGEDFLLHRDNGPPCLVEARHARVDEDSLQPGSAADMPDLGLDLLPHGGETHLVQTIVCDGDAVEVIGYLERRIDPDVERRSERAVPLRTVLHGSPERPLIVRPLGPDHPGGS